MQDSEKQIRKTAKKLIKNKKQWTPAEVAYAKMLRKKLKKWSFRYFQHHYYTVSLILNLIY